MLTARNLVFQYQQEKKLRFPDIACASESKLLIIGPSGIGKTTLLHLLAGLLKPQEGQVVIDNTDISSLNTSKLDRFRGQHIGIIFQKMHFVQSLTVIENLLLQQYLAGIKQDKTRAQALLDRLGIGAKARKLPRKLSQGEQQRAIIARAFINKPKVILADEPTSSLDDQNSEKVISLVEEQAATEKAALLIVTHDQRLKQKFQNIVTL